MTIQNVLKYVDELYENVFSDSVKLRWINQLEAELQTEVLLLATDGITQYTDEDEQAELIAPAPFDKIYEDYLIWRIALAQGEAERANNLQQIYEQSWLAYNRFVCETVNPGDGLAEQLRYYLTAYQIAAKHGYTGSEEEWLESLKGATGESGAGLNIKGQVQTEAELPESGLNEGDGYLVGNGTDALLYIWDGNDWFYKARLSIKGDKGEKGDPGEKGEKGDTGATGATGAAFTYDMFTPDQLAGLTGPQGKKGETGERGEKGEPGEKGAKGDTGAKGERGETGATGATGAAFTYDMFTPDQLAGLTGPPGEKGDPGEKGEKGDTGATGAPGEKGEKGDKGDTGATGAAGAKGDKGEKGEKGDKGDTGSGFRVLGYYASVEALEAAVTSPTIGDAYGVGSTAPYDIYIYSPTGWVNNGQLQGAKGDPGQKGEKGEPGDRGADGAPGAKGDKGEPGEPGTDGLTPTIGENGNWYLGGTDTGKPSRGEKGEPGADGAPGAKGDTGATGATGAPGEKGDKGNPGEPGADGYTPVKGTDYWTEADIAEIKSYVDEAILGGAW